MWIAANPILGRAPLRDFKTLFGVSTDVVAAVWNVTSFDDDINLLHLLWALIFLKTYNKEATLIALVGGNVSRKTYRKKVWSVLESLSQKSRALVSICCFHICICLRRIPLTCFFRYVGRIDLKKTKGEPVRLLSMEQISRYQGRHPTGETRNTTHTNSNTLHCDMR